MKLDGGGGFGRAVDSLFNADGGFEDAERERIVSYAVRRIIYGAQFVIDEMAGDDRSAGRLMVLIEYYLLKNTYFAADDQDLERVKALIYSAIENAKKKVSSGTRNVVSNSCRVNGDSRCYICGLSLNFENSDRGDSAEVEHVHPHEFGGGSDEDNLKLSCRSCNSQKENSIGSFDYFFERITTRYSEGHPKWGARLFKSPNALALLLKERSRCSICGQGVQEAGELRAFRLEESDSWHYFNIGMKCNNH